MSIKSSADVYILSIRSLNEEWALVAPYLLPPEGYSQHAHVLCAVFKGLRDIIKTGVQWRQMLHDLPPWPAVYQQVQRWLAADYFVVQINDLRAVLRAALDRSDQPSAVIVASCTLSS